ncbi:MAG: hypothetical protein J6D52_10160, partial [Clostridia bacterium]|nr:hypothetical protein [Clostridia bacterium]
RVEDEAYVLNEEELRNETETPFIEYDPASGEVVNHEGRHRMVALKADGIESVAILLKPSNDSFERRTVQDISLTGQSFAEGRASGNVTVKSAVPLSEKYRTEAVAQFAQNPDADVRYSLPTEGIPSQPLHYVKMYSEAMKDSKLKRLYEEAKNGNDEAAVELADYCFDDKFTKEISNKYNGCYLISINGIDGKSINKIPMVISSTLSKKTNLKNFLGIFKISKNNMRDKTNAERLSEKVLFDTIDDDVYNSIKGKRFVIVDDTVNTGTTTNALARYLEKAGGKVAGTVSLFKGQDHYNNQAITEDLLIKIESRLGRENAERFIRQYGYADKLEQLTRKQAEHLLKIGIDNSRGTRNAEGGGKTSVEGGGRILSQASGKTKTISTELEADSNDGSVSSLPEKGEKQFSIPDIAKGKTAPELWEMSQKGEITSDDALKVLAEQYGTMPKGENPKVDVTLPEQISKSQNVNQFMRNVLESGHLDADMSETEKRNIISGARTYKPISDKAALSRAESKIKTDVNGAVQEWENIINSGKRLTKFDVALGEQLLVQAADTSNANDVTKYIAELADIGTQSGQVTQALRLLKQMTGIGQLYYVTRTVARLNKDIEADFEFGKNNLEESVTKQKGNYDIFAQMLSCFSDVISNAVGIETHNRNAEGYKPDPTLKNVYVLCSACENKDDIIPVKLSIKEFS